MAPWVHWQEHGFILTDNRASHDRRRWMCVLKLAFRPNPAIGCLWSTIMGYIGFGCTGSLICLLLTSLRRPCDSRRCVLGEVSQLIHTDPIFLWHALHASVLNGSSRLLSRHAWGLLEAISFYSPWRRQRTPMVCSVDWPTLINY